MPRYRKVGKASFHPVDWQGPFTAFDVAQECYKQDSKLDFWADIVHYHHTGFVCARPHLFAMGKPIEYEGRRGWFIQMAVGNLAELLSCIPCPLAFVAFCRRGDENMRVIEWDPLVRWIARVSGFAKQMKEMT